MSGKARPPRPTRGLRLVVDEGRTVADPVDESADAQLRTAFHPSARAIGGRLPSRSPPPRPVLDEAPDGNVHVVDVVMATDSDAVAAADPGMIDVGGDDAPASADRELCAGIEAVLMVATEPVPVDVLASVLAASSASVEELCTQLAREYAHEGRGFALMRVAGGYRLQTAPAAAEYVERFLGESRQVRLSAAAMETLAVVAYKQPVSRAQISAIRGVNADAAVRKLADHGYVAEVARDPGPGRAVLLGTTPLFLERMGFDSLDDLPSLAQLHTDDDAAEAFDRVAADRSRPA